jgi:SH3-like domain-containing protein
MIRLHRRSFVILLAVTLSSASGLPNRGDEAAAQGASRGTGLPLPRFVSVKSDNVNVRRGPGQEYDVAFTFVREGVPVEITLEFDNWRKIRDSDGAEGWIFHGLLSGDRTALIAPWQSDGNVPIHNRANSDAAIVAYLEPRVIVKVAECTGTWCLVGVEGYEGWITQESLWGVYPGEEFDE